MFSTGLFLVDLLPSMSSSTLTLTQSSDIQIHQLWSRLGVFRIDVHQEGEDSSGQPLGVITMLVQETGHQACIRMWGLGSLLNLARWRAYTEGSASLDVHFDSGSMNSSPISPRKKAPSASGGFIKSLFQTRQTGKGKAVESTNAPEIDSNAAVSAQETADRFSTPLDWIYSSVLLPLPRGQGPILFFERLQMPCGNGKDRSARREEQVSHGWLFLIVATARTCYVFESKAANRRTWKLTKELFAPSTPTSALLVRLSNLNAASGPYPPDVAIFLGMSTKAALIYLNDSSVVELDLPGEPSASRHRSKSSASATSSVSAKSSLSARASVIGSHALHQVAALVEGSKGVPAGMRGSEKQIALGKRLDDGVAAIDGLTIGGVSEKKWTDCRPLSMRTADDDLLHALLVTRGHLTHLLASQETSSRVVPLHTFEWPHSASQINHITALVRRRTLKPMFSASGFVHLLLVGFLPTGIVAQEGILDTALLRSHILDSCSPSNSSEPIYRRLASFGSALSPEWPLQQGLAKDVDVQDEASLDFCRQVKYLTPGGPWFNSSPDTHSRGREVDASDELDESSERVHRAMLELAERDTRSGVFVSVQGLSGWSLQWLG
ncbi:hypothetical protein ACM66B_000588 [Microbotryomycetes sp. NB124-2]